MGLLLIVILTYVNVVGLRWGALLQNVSTWTKFVAMAGFVILGFAIGKGDWSHFHSAGMPLNMGLSTRELISAMGVALIAVFRAYDGWVYVNVGGGRSERTAAQCAPGDGAGSTCGGRDLPRHEHDLCVCVAHERDREARNDCQCRGCGIVFSEGGAVAFGGDCDFMLQRGGVVHAGRRTGLFGDGAGWSFFRRMAVIHPKWRTPAFSLIGQGVWAGVLTMSGRYAQLYTYVIYGMVLSYS